MIFVAEDILLPVDQVSECMDRYDIHGSFESRHWYPDGFTRHFNALIAAGQVMTFTDSNDEIYGLCSWFLTDEGHQKDINKIRWTLPDQYTQGNILYVSSCVTSEEHMIKEFIQYLTKRFIHKVDTAMWFHVRRGKFFTKHINRNPVREEREEAVHV